jgi:hypothetical protein
MFVKLSILGFTYRLSSKTAFLRRIIWFTVFLVVLACFGCVFSLSFSCRPLGAAWNINIVLFDTYKCEEEWKYLLAWAVLAAATDVWMVILPSIIVWRLHMPKRTRLGVVLIFTCGLNAACAAIAKAATVVHAYNSYDPCCKSTSVKLMFMLTY